jgi:hypothetical protein
MKPHIKEIHAIIEYYAKREGKEKDGTYLIDLRLFAYDLLTRLIEAVSVHIIDKEKAKQSE